MTKVFFDTEFTGLHMRTTLISIGLVSECGRTFYAELSDYDVDQIDGWLLKNVLENLKFAPPAKGENEYYVAARSEDSPIGNDLYNSYSLQMRCNTPVLKKELTAWLGQFNRVEMWSDCLAYDWVLFNNIFGSAFDIPKNVYYIPLDICTLFYNQGIDPDIPREGFAFYNSLPKKIEKHNALWDAKVIKLCFERLVKESNVLIKFFRCGV